MHNQTAQRPVPRPAFSARLYAGLFRVFGPAQLGDPDEAPPPPAPAAAPCPRCGASLDTHVFIETAERKRLLRCQP